jgi:hypothetical protein
MIVLLKDRFKWGYEVMFARAVMRALNAENSSPLFQ